jgi:putative protease
MALPGAELLAPAGDMEALYAAVEAGADAVYLGGKRLSARKNAGNFDAEGLCRAADYCHERGRRLYVTVNTLIRDEEFPQLEDLAGQIARSGADAAIVQDFGVAAALRAMLPSLPLHASTQMAIHNRQGVDFLSEHGFSRVVLAREMAFSEIEDCAGRGVGLEVFVPRRAVRALRAMLFPSVLGGRSGNQACAPPCRCPGPFQARRRTRGRASLHPGPDPAHEPSLLLAAGVTSLKTRADKGRPTCPRCRPPIGARWTRGRRARPPRRKI